MRRATVEFRLPPGLEAKAPPEARGLKRDQVRLLVSLPGRRYSSRFDQLAYHLRAGDLVVYNDSATLPNSLLGGRLHLSTELDDGRWVVEVRDSGLGSTIELPDNGVARLGDPYRASKRLRLADLELPSAPHAYLAKWGRPIRYQYLEEPWPLASYQTVFARNPGSAEMPSAGRAFSAEVLTTLACAGVRTAALTLHTGVSSLENGEPPYPEKFQVPASTLRLVEQTRRLGGRVVAVGTTVARALESVRDHGLEGWTDRVISAQDPPSMFDGLLSGFHEPNASHLDLLVSLIGEPRLLADYRFASSHRYLWHEFGDLHLMLRGADAGS